MKNESINFALDIFNDRLILQRYSNNTIKSYMTNCSAPAGASVSLVPFLIYLYF